MTALAFRFIIEASENWVARSKQGDDS